MAGEILDSGNRRQFSTGAVRDISDDKGREDLLPMDIIAEYLSKIYTLAVNNKREKLKIDEMFNKFSKFMESGNTENLYDILYRFINREYNESDETAIMELAKHYQQGALKYSERNWETGLPCHCFVDSALRHGLKYFRGDQDEPHNRAFMWNVVGLLWTLKHKPEMNDLPYNTKKEENEESKQEVILEDVKSEEPSNITITTEDTTNKVYPDKSNDDKLDQEYLSLFFKFPSEVVELHDKYHDKFEGTKIPLVIVEASGKCEYYGLNSDDLLMNKKLGGIAIPCNKLKELIGNNYKTIIKVAYNENPSNIYISLDGIEYYFSNYEFDSFLKYSNIAFNTDSDKTPVTTSDTTASTITTEVKEDEDSKEEEYIWLKLRDDNAVSSLHTYYTRHPNAYITITNLEYNDSKTTLFLKRLIFDIVKNNLIIPMNALMVEDRIRLVRKRLSYTKIDNLNIISYANIDNLIISGTGTTYKVDTHCIKTYHGEPLNFDYLDYYLVLFFAKDHAAEQIYNVINSSSADKLYVYNLAYKGSKFELLIDNIQFSFKKNALIIPEYYLKQVSGNNWEYGTDIIQIWNMNIGEWGVGGPLIVEKAFKGYDLIIKDELDKDYI